MKPFYATTLLALFAAPGIAADDEVLPPEEVFRYTVSATAQAVRVDWTIEPGYYLYRHRFGFVAGGDDVELGPAELPDGKRKVDEFFGETEIYRKGLSISIPLARVAPGTRNLRLEIRSQGCADFGLCYPPQRWFTDVRLPDAAGGAGTAGPVTPPGGGNTLAALLDRSGAGAGAPPDTGFLPPEQAFVLTAEMADAATLRVRWDIAEGYYLYRDKFGFSADDAPVQLGEAALPAGSAKYDEFFGDVEVYYDEVEALIPVTRRDAQAGDFELQTAFQGCAEDGICYPPMTRAALVLMPAASAGDGAAAAPPPATAAAAAPVSRQDRFADIIVGGHLAVVAAVFFGSGLLLAFTPCVLPMVPILSGIIVGQGSDITTGRAFTLSLIYVLAMALTYTGAGVAAALLGQNLQAMFQHPAVIYSFAALFVLLALSMFGLYELQVPPALQSRLNELSNRQGGGTTIGVAIMGVLSALIVGPCVAAPLVGALIVIGQTGDPVRGGVALFALSMGMGAPLLAFGASAGHLLPRAGSWMNAVRGAFGVMLLAVAIWMLDRVVPGQVTMLLWAALVFMTGVFMGALQPLPQPATGWHKMAKGTGLLTVVYGTLLLIGATGGATDPLRPLEGRFAAAGAGTAAPEHLTFRTVKTVADLEREVRAASAASRTVMLDFYADWCVSCKEMEKYTFSDPQVQRALGDTVLLQADVTANDRADRELLAYFGIFGPPTIAFFDRTGEELRPYRVVGFMPAQEFLPHIVAATDGQAVVAASAGKD